MQGSEKKRNLKLRPSGFLPDLRTVAVLYKGMMERSIFQTFWKQEGCTNFLFLELETSNFGLFFNFL